MARRWAKLSDWTNQTETESLMSDADAQGDVNYPDGKAENAWRETISSIHWDIP